MTISQLQYGQEILQMLIIKPEDLEALETTLQMDTAPNSTHNKEAQEHLGQLLRMTFKQ